MPMIFLHCRTNNFRLKPLLRYAEYYKPSVERESKSALLIRLEVPIKARLRVSDGAIGVSRRGLAFAQSVFSLYA